MYHDNLQAAADEPPAVACARSLDDYLSHAAQESHRRRRRRHPDDPTDESGNACSWCNVMNLPWQYYLVFLSMGVANSSDASEILCLSYILSDAQFDVNILLGSQWRGGLLAAAVFCGMLFGGLLVGALGDVRGRRPTLLFGLATNCICGILSAMAWNVWSLSLLRLVAGVGIGATVPPLFTICSELAPPKDRGFWVTVAASFWMVGSIYVALMGWWILGGGGGSISNDEETVWLYSVTSRWRVFAVTCAVPSALGWMMVFSYVPESPRFLALQGYHDEAASVANKLTRAMMTMIGNNPTVAPPLTGQELLEHYPLQDRQQDTEIHQLDNSSCSTPTFVGTMCRDFVKSASGCYVLELKSTTLGLQLVWFSLSFGSYGLLTWINKLFVKVHLQNVYANALLFSLANLPGNILSASLMDRTGRTTMLVGSIVAAALSLVAFAYVAAQDAKIDASGGDSSAHLSREWIVAAACAFQCFTISAWNSIDVLSSELFPTSVRATGMGLCAASGRIGAMLAQFVNGMLVDSPARLLLVAATTLLLGGMTPSWCLPRDQTGQPMSDTVGGGTAVAADEDNACWGAPRQQQQQAYQPVQDDRSGENQTSHPPTEDREIV